MKFYQWLMRYIRSLLVIFLACLMLEQLLYCLLVPHYFMRMLASPVFWAMESFFCFMGLWRFNQRYPSDNPVSEASSQDFDDLFEYMERDSRWYPLFDPVTGLSRSDD